MLAEKPVSEIDRNFEAFERLLPELLQKSPGKFVVMHRGEVVLTFDTFADAALHGHEKFGRDNFSVQDDF